MSITEGNINGLKRVILRGIFMYMLAMCKYGCPSEAQLRDS